MPIFGTLVTSGIALLIGIPVSFGIALFLTELSPRWMRRPLGIAIELLAGIPSIIYGMWGLFVFAPFFADNIEPWINQHIGKLPMLGPFFSGPPMGIGMLTAGIILAIMVIPFIASVMRDVFEVVPTLLKESAYGVGATTWEVVWNVVLPYTKIGVVGGIMLGLGRALGETMAVTFVIGNAHAAVQLAADAGQQHRLRAGQRIHRGGRRALHLLADRARPDPVLHHLRRALAARASCCTGWPSAKGTAPDHDFPLYPPPLAQLLHPGHLGAGHAVRPVLAGLDTVDPAEERAARHEPARVHRR